MTQQKSINWVIEFSAQIIREGHSWTWPCRVKDIASLICWLCSNFDFYGDCQEMHNKRKRKFKPL